MTEPIQDENQDKNKKWSRRQLVVAPNIQYWIVFYAVSFGAIMFSMGAVFTFMFQRVTFLKNDEMSSIGIGDISMAALLVLVFWAWIYFGMVITNKVAGPIFRIKSELEKVKNGQGFKKIAFREKDFFQDLAFAYNDAIEQLNKNEEAQKKSK